jgi:hypothetical protein
MVQFVLVYIYTVYFFRKFLKFLKSLAAVYHAHLKFFNFLVSFGDLKVPDPDTNHP